mmetsp:Transcript_9128/g.22900  ORF Transcript_9128/g.22900 Transcript_9128/m.22900 type:complete len:80 (-) Transcript_9128:327-566(-)
MNVESELTAQVNSLLSRAEEIRFQIMRLERAVHFPWAQVRDEFEVITHSYERLQEEIPDVFAHFVAQPFGIPPQNVPGN